MHKTFNTDQAECPYCGYEQEINHDDGYGYDESELYEQECYECFKTFVFSTCISYSYYANQAPCRNGRKHKYKSTCTYPKEYTKLECIWCADRIKPNQEDMDKILQDKVVYRSL